MPDKLKFKVGQCVRRIGGRIRMTVKYIVNNPELQSLYGPKIQHTKQDKKKYRCKWTYGNRQMQNDFFEDQLEVCE